MGRSHPRCWTGDRYEHHCHEPSGRYCIETGCCRQAGTPWGPYWCPEHDVERLDRISAGLEGIAASLRATTERRVLRWITWTSDQVALALEETEDAGVAEWTLALGDEVTVR